MVAIAATRPIAPALKDGLRSIESLGREHDPLSGPPGGADPGEPVYRADPEGPRAIHLAGMAEHWLTGSPEGELRWGDRRARAAALAFVDGWACTAIHRLAAGPMGLGALDEAIGEFDREEIEPCLEAMARHGIVEPLPGPDGEGGYALSEWGREGVASLIASARLERTVPDRTAPIEDIDVQAAFGLALPLARLRDDLAGSCAVSVELDDSRSADVTARFERGRLVSWQPGIDADADARAWGGVDGWFRAVIEARLDGMAAAGDTRFATAILEGLHERLFALDE